MVAVVTNQIRGRFDPTVAQMHRDRKAVFVDMLGWEIPVVGGEFEADEYDTEMAVYLIVQHPGSGAHLGSLRLLRSAGPHLLGDKFAFLCNGPVPTGPAVWEITRLCTTPAIDGRTAQAVRLQLVMAVMEFGLANGVASYTTMTHAAYLPTLLAVGWDVAPLGLPAPVTEGLVGALQILVSAASLDRLRRLHGFTRAVLEAPRNSSTLVA